MLFSELFLFPPPTEVRLSRIYPTGKNTLQLPLNHSTKYVLFSDCHRGIGNANDNFLKNEYLYTAALNHYYSQGFTYIELGDGDELWENRSMQRIKEMHENSFRILSRFYADQRLFLLYGNHDMIKKNPEFCRDNFSTYYSDCPSCEHPLCPGITFYEGIVLHNTESNENIFLTHGHQAEALNSTLWLLSRFLVRYLWKPLESLGVPDPTSAARNTARKGRTESALLSWAKKHNCILITGHTHRPMTGSRKSPYFNTGSCVHPSGITCIELKGTQIFLARWSAEAGSDMVLRVTREQL